MAGSTLYRLTWKARATPSGLLICALRALAPRTSASVSTSVPAGWPTPTTRDWKDGGNPDVNVPINALLGRTAWLAGWPTPQARDHFPAHSPEYIAAKKAQGHGMANLNDLVQLVGPARCTASGEMLTGFIAAMPSGGQLNPELSRWLMGYPGAWGCCGATAMPSSRKSRLPSSMPSEKPSDP